MLDAVSFEHELIELGHEAFELDLFAAGCGGSVDDEIVRVDVAVGEVHIDVVAHVGAGHCALWRSVYSTMRHDIQW